MPGGGAGLLRVPTMALLVLYLGVQGQGVVVLLAAHP